MRNIKLISLFILIIGISSPSRGQEDSPPPAPSAMDIEKVDKRYRFLFKESQICGQPVEQLQALLAELGALPAKSSKQKSCEFLLETLRKSFAKSGISRVGGCHEGTSGYFVTPKKLRSCAAQGPKAKKLFLDMVEESKLNDNKFWGQWNLAFAEVEGVKSRKGKAYLKKAKAALDEYYLVYGEEGKDKEYAKIYMLLKEKRPRYTVLGYWEGETTRDEFTILKDKSLSKSENRFLKEFIKAFSSCLPCISGTESAFVYATPDAKEKLYNDPTYKKISSPEFTAQLDKFIAKFSELKAQPDKYELRTEVEQEYQKTLLLVEKILNDHYKIRKRRIQDY